MDQIERIKYYEKILSDGEKVINNLNLALDLFESFKNKKKELDLYFNSAERKLDIESDEENILPSDLKRGVLSEDYTYDFLMTYDKYEKIIEKLK